jgi:bacillithiol biosynthesis cysteine-adding enzyme BshC
MDCHQIKQTVVGRSSRLFGDLLYRFDRAQSFYSFNPFDRESFFRAARELSYPQASRAAVAAALQQQAAAFGAGEPSRRNIDRLHRGAAAIVTGQQVGLFGGPAFALYKALTAIRLAAWLTGGGLDCVPVFWLAADDHDLEEVNHAYLLDAEHRPQRIADPGAPHPAGAPVGRIRLSAGIGQSVERALTLLPESPGKEQIAAALEQAYRPGETFSSAFGRLMARLLEPFGIILLDPTHPALRGLAAEVFRQAIVSAAELCDALLERNRQLVKAGYHTQVHVTEQSTLLFIERDGRRTALQRSGDEFAAGNQALSPGELLALLERRPQDFSPNALLRPVVQDTLLPTVAYVGGPAELAYMAQAAPLYRRLLGRVPVVFPRAGFTIVGSPVRQLLGLYGLEITDVAAGPQRLREKMGLRFLPPELATGFAEDERRLNALLADVRRRLEPVDHTLAEAAALAARKMSYQLEKLKRKAGRAAARSSGELERDAAIIENVIHPHKEPQERFYSGISLLARFGLGLLDELYARVPIDDPDHRVLYM